MKINIVKKHPTYGLGIVEVNDQRAEYLIRTGIAESADKAPAKKATVENKQDVLEGFEEKQEIKPSRTKKEKSETKSDNVPTAKKRK